MAKLDYEKLNATQRYLQYAVFRAIPGALGTERDEIIAEAEKFFEQLKSEGKVVVRGIYDNTGIRADADFMIWWHAEEFEYIQDSLARFRRDTALGQLLEVSWLGNGIHRPAEFNKSHLPSFIMGEEPKDWITVYPFVRSYDWYVMEAEKRRKILMEHGMAGRDYPDVRANTVEAFVLGDYEWMLSFEADTLERIESLMKTMRYTEARLHVREEIPFQTGRRVASIADVIKVLP